MYLKEDSDMVELHLDIVDLDSDMLPDMGMVPLL
jgi:hypothetical protein